MKRYLREQFMRATTLLITLLFTVTYSPLAYSNPFSGDAFGFSSGSQRGPGSTTGSSGVTPQNHTNKYRKCEEMAGMKFSELQGHGSGSYLEIFAAKEAEFISEMAKKSGVVTTSNGTPGDASAPKEIDATNGAFIARYLDNLMTCEAIVIAFNAENYTSDAFEVGDNGVSGETTSAMNAGAMQCLNQGNQQQQQQCMAQQAASGQEIKCKHFGPETHDFLECKRIVNFLDGFVIGKQVMGVQQQFRAGSAAIDAQSDLAKKAREQGGLKVVDTMGVQRDSLEQQGNLMYEMAAFDAAKAGTLMSMISGFPRPSGLIESCTSSFTGTSFTNATTTLTTLAEKIARAVAGPAPEGAEDTKYTNSLSNITSNSRALGGGSEGALTPESVCTAAIGTGNGQNNKLFVNQKMIETVRGIAVKAGLEAMANGAKGMLLHDQAKMVDDAMNDIQEFEPPEFPVAEFPEETASECLVDPNAEGCIAPNTPGFEGFRNGSFSANIGGSANLGDGTLAADLDDDASSTSAGAKRDLIPNSFGSVEAQGNSDNSFEGGVAGAGSIKAGQAAPGGGGGAPAGGGGGAFGGGGGANKAAAAKKPSGIKNIKIKTKGDGLGVVGGNGRIGASKKKAANPFAKLLGNNKKGNGSLSFRGPAQVGGKKGSIFQMISNRYSVVNKKNRLLKYEAKE